MDQFDISIITILQSQAGKMEQFWAGGLAGVLCWLSVLPFDVVKSRMQADSLDITKRRYTGALDCMRQSMAKEGPGVFFRYQPIRGFHYIY